MTKSILITGPTGAGKTAAVNYLSETYDLDVINMDSIQTFKFFKIGSGRSDMNSKKYHLYGYQHPLGGKPIEKHIGMAKKVMKNILKDQKDKLVVMEGGSMTYLSHIIAEFDPYIIAIEAADLDWVREKMKKRTLSFMEEGLIQEVAKAIHKGYRHSYVLTQERVVYVPVLEHIENKISYKKLLKTIEDNMFNMHIKQLRFLKRIQDVEWFENSEGFEQRIAAKLSTFLK